MLSMLLLASLSACGSSASTFGIQRVQAPSPFVSGATKYTLTTVDNPADPSFNRLQAINNLARLGGFYGDGTIGHANHGYIVYPPYAKTSFRHVDFPAAVDTQVTSLNNRHFIGGFYVDTNGNTLGFIDWLGIWFSYQAPHVSKTKPVTEILGLNDAGFAVGYYITTPNTEVAFQVKISTGKFQRIKVPGATNAVATGISGRGHICGYMKTKAGATVGFLLRQGVFYQYSYPHSKETRPLGITSFDHVVGSYVDNAGKTHGFVSIDPHLKRGIWQSIDFPGSKATVVASVNQHGDIVGYYVKSDGTNHGFLGTPK